MPARCCATIALTAQKRYFPRIMTNGTTSSPTETTGPYLVAALYHFVSFPRFGEFREPLQAFCVENSVVGSLLIAHEGINGTIAGPDEGLRKVLAYLRAQPEFAGLEHKESRASKKPFIRMKVKLKKEIVTMGVENIDPLKVVGTYVAPRDWNALITDPDTIVIDTRNDYETALGVFRGAVDPNIKTFREFPDWVKANEGLHNKPKIAMYCTGGIRCEKATAYMKEQGFEDVFHLKGGILKYLEEVPAEESLWEGACFVFDERVSVTQDLREGGHKLCRACRNPLTPEAIASPQYEAGVSCPHCYEVRSEEDRNRFRERERQTLLARQRGLQHFGS
jgi:UPF0176 protein